MAYGKPGRPAVRVFRVCLTCDKGFIRKPSKMTSLYCSRDCRYAGQRLVSSCGVCGTGIAGTLSRPPKFCSLKCFGMSPEAQKGLDAGRYLSGERAGGWKGGRMSSARHHVTREHRAWRRQVIARDGACVWCGSDQQLQADHIIPLILAPERALDLDNGRTLCKPCHQKTDTYAGRANRLARLIEGESLGVAR